MAPITMAWVPFLVAAPMEAPAAAPAVMMAMVCLTGTPLLVDLAVLGAILRRSALGLVVGQRVYRAVQILEQSAEGLYGLYHRFDIGVACRRNSGRRVSGKEAARSQKSRQDQGVFGSNHAFHGSSDAAIAEELQKYSKGALMSLMRNGGKEVTGAKLARGSKAEC